jgi:hypothetical protein
MPVGADLQQAADTAAQLDAPLGGAGDARQDLQERTLAGAVAADDAHHFARLDLEAHVAEGPEFIGALLGAIAAPAQRRQR